MTNQINELNTPIDEFLLHFIHGMFSNVRQLLDLSCHLIMTLFIIF